MQSALRIILSLSALFALSAAQDLTLKAPSTFNNCGCQCSSLTFVDNFGRIQGNCKSTDNTGARWCYVPHRNTCGDLRRSQRFRNKWSYEACATPVCGGHFGGNNGFGHNNNGFGHNNNGFGHNNNGFGHNNNGFGHNNNGFGHNGFGNGFGSSNNGFSSSNGFSSGNGFSSSNNGFSSSNGGNGFSLGSILKPRDGTKSSNEVVF